MENKALLKMGRVLAALVASTVAFTTACNQKSSSGLRVAGGTIDGSDGSVKYPATTYVEMSGQDFGGRNIVIRNVGSLVDLGQEGKLALIFSLADSIQTSGGQSVLPLFKSASIKLFMSDDKDSITLSGLSYSKKGLLVDQEGRSFVTLAVGFKPVRNADVKTSVPDDEVLAYANKVLLAAPLEAGGKDFRVPETTYMIVSVPRSSNPALASLKAPLLIAAEDRAPESSLSGLQIVGFGENIVGGEKKKEFGLSDGLSSVMKRNYADVVALNKDKDLTPLRKLMGADSSVAKQVWEISGSGLCGSSDGQNFDTGASVYQDGKYLGYAVRSSVKSSGYKGRLECRKTSRDDMASIIISPSREAIAKFKEVSGK